MTHLSALAILPKFLWKHIAVYLSLRDIGVNRSIAGFKRIFDDDYCKSRLLSDTVEAIIVVKTKSNDTSRFWKHAMFRHQKYTCLLDLFEVIRKTKFRKFTYITVFMKPGIYSVKQVYIRGNYGSRNNKYSISIIGSISDPTTIIEQTIPASIWYIEAPRCISFENIIFDTASTLEGMINKGSTVLTHITNCKFNNWLYVHNIQKLFISNCEFNKSVIIDTITQSSITQCVFNIESEIILFNVSIDFNNNIVIPKQILHVKQLENNTIIVRNNAVSDCVACINFGDYTRLTENDHIIIQNNHLITIDNSN